MYSCARIISKSDLRRLLLSLLALSFSALIHASGVMDTAGSFSVTPSGAATYTIPLTVPPGTAGMEPKLSLSYDSQSVNGALGVGWTLAGLSTIHRCAATVAQDGFHGAVNLDGNDRFCLDDQRLIAISGGNGGDGTEYRTEKETFSKIVSYGVSGSGPAYFVVSTKSGQTLEFGVTADSRIAAQGQATVLTWALDRVSDKLGNYFTVSYNNDNANGEYVPTRVDYTGNAGAGLAPQQAVVFTYQGRPDIDHYFFANSAVVHGNRLANVQMFNAGALVTDYRLVYDQSPSTGRSRLTTLTQCAGDGACMPPTIMSWQNASNNFPTATTNAGVPSWVNDANTQMFMGDFDGDGKTDLVLKNAAFGTTPVMFSNGDGNWRFTNASVPAWVNDTNTQMILGDFNGDGRTDIVLKNAGFASTPVMFSNGDGTWNFTNAGVPSWVNDPNTRMYAGDFNGDGRTDLVLQNAAFGTTPVMFSNGDGNFTIANLPVPAWVNDPNTQMILGDFNGDGRTDILLKNPGFGTTPILFSNGDGSWTIVNNAVPAWVNDPNSQLIAGDFNGDGKTDILVKNPAFTTIHVMFASGNGNWGITEFAIPDWFNATATTIFTGDFNGDGKTDLGIRNPGFATNPVLFSNGDGTWTSNNSPAPGWVNLADTVTVAGDFNGDGKTDIVAKNPGFTSTPVMFSDATAPDVISGITTGLGVTTQVTYKSITDPSVYTKDTNATYPIMDVVTPVFVVANVAESNGVGGMNGSSYAYAGAKSDAQGRGFLGFRSLQMVDNTTGITARTDYHQDYPYIGVPAGTTKSLAGIVLSQVTNSAAAQPLGGTRYFTYIAQSVEQRNELDGAFVSAITTNTSYDGWGNAVQVTISTSDGYTKTVNNTYSNDTTNWILGKLTQAQLTNTIPGGATQTRTSSFTYNPANGLLTQEAIEPGTTLALVTDYTYDAFGNRTQATVSAPDIQTRSSQTAYDAQGRFPVSSVNALGQRETYAFDGRFGVKIRLTDINNLITNWSYNGFGRKLSETRPDGTQTTWNYQYLGTAPTPLAFNAPSGYSITTASTGVPTQTAFYDTLDRKTQTQTQGFDGSTIYKSDNYDTLGRIAQSSRNYYGGGNPYWTNYGYDAIGRLTTVVEPNGAQSRIVYSGLSTFSTDALNHTTTRVKNTQDQVIQVIDSLGNSTRYQYDPFGNLTKTIDPAGNQVAMGYDIRGRKTVMDDPDMGHWTYRYDALGELVGQTDAKGQSITLMYDLLGRMVWRQEPDLTTNWVWDSAFTGKGKLGRVYTDNGYAQGYFYDGFSRIRAINTSVGGVGYNVRVTYDSSSRVNQYWYPTNFTVTNVYNAFGYLAEVHNGTTNALLWRGNAQDADHHSVNESLGNGLVTTRAYDNATGHVSLIQTGNSAGAGGVQNQQFVFDNVGNLTQRVDGVTGVNESFSYDEVNRMLTAYNPALGSKSYSYDAIGNITYKSDVGSYTYGSKPHAVVTAGRAARVNVASQAQGGVASASSTFSADYPVAAVNDGDRRGGAWGHGGGWNDATNGQYPDWVQIDFSGSKTINEIDVTTIQDDYTNPVEPTETLTFANYGITAYNVQYWTGTEWLNVPGGVIEGNRNVLRKVTFAPITTSKIRVLVNGAANIDQNYVYSRIMEVEAFTPGGDAATYAYDANGNMISGAGRSVSYTSYNMPSSLSGPGGTVNYLYGPDHLRVQETGPNGTTVYLNPRIDAGIHFEKETAPDGTVKNEHYLYAGSQLIGMYITRSNGPDQVRYFHQDHLGSISVISDEIGAVVERLSFDPHGKRRNANGSDDNGGTLAGQTTHHGFTGHEHIDALGLINMNGRVYDPLLGRFLSADPTVQNPLDPQDLNRYAYARNNPLSLVDLDGYGWLSKTWHKIWRNRAVRAAASILIAVYAPQFLGSSVIGMTSVTAQTVTAGFLSGYVGSGGDLKAGAISAMTAGAFNLVGGAATNGWSPLEKIAVHGLVGGAASVASGGKFGSGFLAAAFGEGMTPVINNIDFGTVNPVLARTAATALVGGVASVLGGGKFEDGAVTAAFGYLFNCIAHECLAQGRDAERTFVGYLKEKGLDNQLGLGFNRWSDGQGNYFLGRPDIFSTDLGMVWDVKPDSIYGWSSGAEQIGRYTSVSGYSPGTGTPLFGGQASIVLTGSMNRYEYTFGGNGLVIYQALDLSPMERSIQQALKNQAVRTLMGPFPSKRRRGLFD